MALGRRNSHSVSDSLSQCRSYCSCNCLSLCGCVSVCVCRSYRKAGAKIAIGVDCSVYSEFTVAVNSNRNNVVVASYTKDLFYSKIAERSIIFASDLIYGQQTSNDLLNCLAELGRTSTVIIAQSGRQNPPYQIEHQAFSYLMSYDVPCFTPGLETIETMPVSLWTCNPLILKDL